MGDLSQPYKDRKAGLVLFGVLTLLMGLVGLLFVLLTLLAPTMAASQGNAAPAPPPHQVFFSAGVLLFFAVAFIWLGIGSIMARRWARALMLIGAWAGLAIGIVSLGWLLFMWPQIQAIIRAAQPPGRAPLPEGIQSTMMATLFAFVAFIYVVIPAVWILFYRSRHVKATCEVRDPKVRWTDRSPLPVLALALWLIMGAIATLAMALVYNRALPFFGMILSGVTGTICYLIIAAIWFYAGWSIYKLRSIGWWVALIGMVIWPVSAVVTWQRQSVSEMLRKMGFTSAQAGQFSGWMTPTLMTWSAIGVAAPMVVYLLCVRKYFCAEVARLR
jgi:hypothetical protein